MRLMRFEISPHRGQPARAVDMGADEAQHPVVAITGPPGCGKSSLLRAIALHKEHIAPYHLPPQARAFLGEDAQARLTIESEWMLTEAERRDTASDAARHTARSLFQAGLGQVHADPALVHVLARFHREHRFAKVDFFTEAWLGERAGAPVGDLDRWQRIHRLDFGSKKYTGLAPLFAAASEADKERVAQLTGALCPGLSPRPDAPTFGTRFGDRPATALSFSERLAFELAATFVLVGLARSVVLFDGLERAFPGGRAAQVIDVLRDHAPDAQLILATNDPAVLALSGCKVIQLDDG